MMNTEEKHQEEITTTTNFIRQIYYKKLKKAKSNFLKTIRNIDTTNYHELQFDY